MEKEKKEKKLLINFAGISHEKKCSFIQTVLEWDDKLAKGVIEKYGAVNLIGKALERHGARGTPEQLRQLVYTIRYYIEDKGLDLNTKFDFGGSKDGRRTAREEYLSSSRTDVKGAARTAHMIGLVANNVPKSQYRKPYRKPE
jgi:hypothetical protein